MHCPEQVIVLLVHGRDALSLRKKQGKQVTYWPGKCTKAKKVRQVVIFTGVSNKKNVEFTPDCCF